MKNLKLGLNASLELQFFSCCGRYRSEARSLHWNKRVNKLGKLIMKRLGSIIRAPNRETDKKHKPATTTTRKSPGQICVSPKRNNSFDKGRDQSPSKTPTQEPPRDVALTVQTLSEALSFGACSEALCW